MAAQHILSKKDFHHLSFTSRCLRFIPLAIAAALFMPLVAITRLIVWVPTVLMSIIFPLLKVLGVVKLTSETREVQRLIIS